jgi:metal-dependent hydrolase (beta-lactamase superfamily II)
LSKQNLAALELSHQAEDHITGMPTLMSVPREHKSSKKKQGTKVFDLQLCPQPFFKNLSL